MFPVKTRTHILDQATEADGRVSLLDGKGAAIANPSPASAVYLPFKPSDIGHARNSRGELFRPNVTVEHFQPLQSELDTAPRN